MAQTYIGAPIRRREDVRFLTGKATFVDDFGSGLAMLPTGGWVTPINGVQDMASAVPSIMCWTAVPPMTGWW